MSTDQLRCTFVLVAFHCFLLAKNYKDRFKFVEVLCRIILFSCFQTFCILFFIICLCCVIGVTHLGGTIAQWLACWTSDREIGVRVLLAAGGHIATMGQLLFAGWSWVYSTLHPFGVGK